MRAWRCSNAVAVKPVRHLSRVRPSKENQCFGTMMAGVRFVKGTEAKIALDAKSPSKDKKKSKRDKPFRFVTQFPKIQEIEKACKKSRDKAYALHQEVNETSSDPLHKENFWVASPEPEKRNLIKFPVTTIGTDCSGMEVPMIAMSNLGVKFEHTCSCDNDP